MLAAGDCNDSKVVGVMVDLGELLGSYWYLMVTEVVYECFCMGVNMNGGPVVEVVDGGTDHCEA